MTNNPLPEKTGFSENEAVLQMFQVLGELPKLLSQVAEQQRQIEILAYEVRILERFIQTPSEEADGWLDASRAKKYLGISRNTFDKYRYPKESKIILRGHKVDGKTLYKRAEIDRFVKLKQLDNRN